MTWGQVWVIWVTGVLSILVQTRWMNKILWQSIWQNCLLNPNSELLKTFLRHFLFSRMVGFPDDEVSSAAVREQRLMAQLTISYGTPNNLVIFQHLSMWNFLAKKLFWCETLMRLMWNLAAGIVCETMMAQLTLSIWNCETQFHCSPFENCETAYPL